MAYRPVVFEVLPETFSLSRLQQVVEAFAGQVLHKQNFRRLVASANLVEPTGESDQRTGGRPAELYRFRREVLGAPGPRAGPPTPRGPLRRFPDISGHFPEIPRGGLWQRHSTRTRYSGNMLIQSISRRKRDGERYAHSEYKCA